MIAEITKLDEKYFHMNDIWNRVFFVLSVQNLNFKETAIILLRRFVNNLSGTGDRVQHSSFRF